MIEIIPHGNIHEIKLARAPVNALNYELLDALVKAIEQAPGNGAQGIVLSGGMKVQAYPLDGKVRTRSRACLAEVCSGSA